MTDPTTPAAAIPAGWYPDPAGGPRKRWWDGTKWTESFEQPYSTATTVLKAPEGTKAYNPWIWLVVFLPYLSLPLLFTVDVSSVFRDIDFSDPNASTAAQLQFMTSPGYLALAGVGFLTAWATVLFSFLDYKALVRAGVPKPFHWAWGFFSVIGYPVYAIGRSVITKRRTGHGSAPLWVSIALLVLAVVVGIAWALSLVFYVVQSVPTTYNY